MPSAQYRPRFVLWTSLLNQLPVHLFLTVWAGGFVGGMLWSIAPAAARALQANVGSPFGVIAALTFCLFPVVTLWARSVNYAATTYSIHPDRIAIEEGFLTQHRKEIRFSAVREINLRRSVLQRMVGLGSVYVATQATGQGFGWKPSALFGGTSTFGSGAMLMDLPDWEEAYERLRGTVEAREREEPRR